jgi:L-iditol 2-dehydrogenase
VRSHRAGVCRTDLEVLAGLLDERWVRYPCIPGHEWSGSVAEVGERVSGLEPGDRVVCEGIIPCHRCASCRAGQTHLCATYDSLGFTRAGGWGEVVVVPSYVVHRLPDSVSFDAAVLVEPAAVVLRALERARLTAGESVGVVGVGTIGALTLMLSRLFVPSQIVAYGIRPEELELARRLGAHRVVDVREDPDGAALDVVVETAGAAEAVELATRLAREGGRVVQLGIAGAGTVLHLPADRLPLRDLELIGSIGYTSAVWGRTVELVRSGLLDLEPLVTHRFAAADFRRAIDLMDHRDGVVGKIVLEHAGA